MCASQAASCPHELSLHHAVSPARSAVLFHRPRPALVCQQVIHVLPALDPAPRVPKAPNKCSESPEMDTPIPFQWHFPRDYSGSLSH